jgi:hypothetical protein
MKGQGMDLEESQITRANPMKKLGVMALIAAVRVIQLVRARDGLTQQKLTDGFDAADQLILKMANKKWKVKPISKKIRIDTAALLGQHGSSDGSVAGPVITNLRARRSCISASFALTP